MQRLRQIPNRQASMIGAAVFVPLVSRLSGWANVFLAFSPGLSFAYLYCGSLHPKPNKIRETREVRSEAEG